MSNRVRSLQNGIDAYWSVAEAWANQAQETILRFLAGDLPSPDARGRSYWDDDSDSPGYEMRGSTALIPISGPLTKQPSWLSWYYGGTSTVAVRQALQAALNDPGVTQICLLIDSPGGQVAGTSDLAMEVAAANLVKPVTAYVSDLCASAAYWIASQARAIYANSTAMVGSIGTYMTLYDSSKAAEEMGIKVYVVKAGDFKGAGQPGTEITKPQLVEWQRVVSDLNAEFVAAVAKGRNMDADQMDALADGRVHVGQAAADLGLVDGICSLEMCLTTLQGSPATTYAARSGNQERNPMNWKEMIKGLLATLKGGEQMSAEERAQLEAAERAIMGEQASLHPVAQPVPTPAPAASAAPSNDAAVKSLQDMLATQNQMIAQMQQQMAQQQAATRYQQHEGQIQSLVRQMKMTPAQAETWKDLAKSNPDAFEAALPALKASPTLAQLTRPSVRAQVGASNPAARLDELTKTRMKQTGESYAVAFPIVARENPDLAQEHKDSAPRVGNATE